MKILFFIESLRSGGKERRLIELIRYLRYNTQHELMIVLTADKVQYQDFSFLEVPLKVISRNYLKKDPILFFRFYKICNEFKPDIIHTWGSMLAFYSLPVVILKKVPHINSHITNAPLNLKKSGFHYLVTKIGFRFSRIILANSYAGLKSYGVSGEKCRVIYNGIRLERFLNLRDKKRIREDYKITTHYAVVMVASYTKNKKYDQFVDVARCLSEKRSDITFIAAGDTEEENLEYERIKEIAGKLQNVKLFPRINEVESLINACDIGVLFTHSEGISNAILEYMACGKPVIAHAPGGTGEIIVHGTTGFLLKDETAEEIAALISELIDDSDKRKTIGLNSRNHIEQNFSLDRMGSDFCNLYSEILIGRY